jgi:hypothetical protein
MSERERLTKVEFYERSGALVADCRSAAVPRQGEYVNIKGQQWRVAYVAWAVDTDWGRASELRANVELEKVPDDEVGPPGNMVEQKD